LIAETERKIKADGAQQRATDRAADEPSGGELCDWGIVLKLGKNNVLCRHSEGSHMPLDQGFFETWRPRALAALRVVAAFLFLQHGTAKLLHVPHVEMFDHLPVFSLIGFAGMLEIIGGLLILLGLYTRAAAFVLSGEMAVAYFMAHAPQGDFLSPMLNKGEGAVLYCFIFLYLSMAGAGAWSLDAMRARK
jgi:putative oxidoreductase